MDMYNFARLFIFLGLAFLAIGGIAYLLTRLGLPLGRLPGDIRIQGQNVTCIIPIVSMILISIVLTVGVECDLALAEQVIRPLKTSDFDYYLPPSGSLKLRLEPRDASRLLVLPRDGGEVQHAHLPRSGSLPAPRRSAGFERDAGHSGAPVTPAKVRRAVVWSFCSCAVLDDVLLGSPGGWKAGEARAAA